MANYGRNFQFRVPPLFRPGRYSLPATGDRMPLGRPVAVDAAAGLDTMGRQILKASSGTTDKPEPGRTGILVYEFAPDWSAGNDPFLVTDSDMDTAPLGAAVQMISGPDIKVAFKNTTARTFLRTRAYAGRIMVAGLGATTTVAVGDYLRPHSSPSDSNGYWQETSTQAEAWLIVTGVNGLAGECEARFVF